MCTRTFKFFFCSHRSRDGLRQRPSLIPENSRSGLASRDFIALSRRYISTQPAPHRRVYTVFVNKRPYDGRRPFSVVIIIIISCVYYLSGGNKRKSNYAYKRKPIKPIPITEYEKLYTRLSITRNPLGHSTPPRRCLTCPVRYVLGQRCDTFIYIYIRMYYARCHTGSFRVSVLFRSNPLSRRSTTIRRYRRKQQQNVSRTALGARRDRDGRENGTPALGTVERNTRRPCDFRGSRRFLRTCVRRRQRIFVVSIDQTFCFPLRFAFAGNF